jgi:hypothetical protein
MQQSQIVRRFFCPRGSGSDETHSSNGGSAPPPTTVPACHRVGGVTAVSAQVVGGSGGALPQTPWPKCRLHFLSAPHSKACCPRCLSIAQGSFSPAEVGRGSGPFGQDVICGHHRSDASPQEAIYPVLLGNWATAVPRTDKSPSWFSATSANSTYFLPLSLAYLPVTVP